MHPSTSGIPQAVRVTAMFLILSDHGKHGTEWTVSTSSREALITDLIAMQWDRPLKVIEINIDEKWCSDISEDIAQEIAARREDYYPPSLLDFLETHLGTQAVHELEAA
jgi:hypothetical protein